MKNVLITGANKRIGFETAKQLAQLGYFIFLGCRDMKKGTDVVNSLNEFGLIRVEALEIDIADIFSVKKSKRNANAGRDIYTYNQPIAGMNAILLLLIVIIL